MAACERCWSEYRSRSMHDRSLNYSDVVAEVERSGRVCTPREQCGDMHLVLDWKDGGRRCRCGDVVEQAPQADAAPQGGGEKPTPEDVLDRDASNAARGGGVSW